MFTAQPSKQISKVGVLRGLLAVALNVQERTSAHSRKQHVVQKFGRPRLAVIVRAGS